MEVKKLTSKQRASEIRAAMAPHLVRMPDGWTSWGTMRLAEFRGDVAAFRRAPSLTKLLHVAGRLAATYGVPMVAIDPAHGEAP